MTNQKSCFLKDFFKKLYFIPTLLISAISFMILYFGYNQNSLDKILSNRNFAIYLICAFGLFIALTTIYCFFTLKKNISFADSIIFTYILVPIAYVLYLFIIAKSSFSLYKTIGAGFLFAVGILLFILRSVNYMPKKKIDKPFYTSGVFKTYYKKIFENFPFLSILSFAFLIVCFAFLFSIKVFVSSKLIIDKFFIIVLMVLPALLYFATAIPSKKIIALDAFLLAIIISSPIIAIQFALVESDLGLDFITSVSLFIVAVIITLIRFKAVEFTYLGDGPIDKIENKPICNYLKQVFHKYNILLVLALGGLTAFVLLLTPFRYSNIFSAVLTSEGKITFVFASLPYLFVNILLYISLATCGILSLINIKSKEIKCGDFSLMYCISFIIFASITLLINFSFYVVIGLIIALIFTFAIISARVRFFN